MNYYEQLGRTVQYIVLNDLLQLMLGSGVQSGFDPTLAFPRQALINIRQLRVWARTCEDENLKAFAAELIEEAAKNL